jgi:hypothetical protein
MRGERSRGYFPVTHPYDFRFFARRQAKQLILPDIDEIPPDAIADPR